MRFFKEFKEFALKGNVLDMAIGLVIGGAFQSIITSLVEDIIMPFKMGAVKMSSATDANIVPFTITGGYKVFGPQRPTIEFYNPIKATHKDLNKDNEKLMDIISKNLEEKRKQ